MAEQTVQTTPERKDVPDEYKWDLNKLYGNDEKWEKGLKELDTLVSEIGSFQGTLGSSAARLRSCFDFMNEIELLEERVGSYAFLRFAEDSGSGQNQERYAKYTSVAAKIHAAASYQTPEIQAIPEETMSEYLASKDLEPFLIPIKKILRYKPHILTESEEKLLALQVEANQTARKAFGALTDVDIDFGVIDTSEGKKPLTQSTWHSFMINPDRELREKVYKQFYQSFDLHKNTLSTLYAGSVHLDKYKAKVRKFESAIDAALFPDDVPAEVYDNLVGTVSENLSLLHRYYGLKKETQKLEQLMHYDVYVPFVSDIQVNHTYEEAVAMVISALSPLGDEYCGTLRDGFLGGWVDRYENKGKRSGAFSSGSYVGDPHILMNYKDDVLGDVFTLAHEGGHSMHSWYSAKNNPIQYYNYTIFEAEVASTFNEQLLYRNLMDNTADGKMRTYLVGKQLDDIVGTLFRQTMFAEFEGNTHTMLEAGEPLTVDSLRGTYRSLLEKYFGPDVGLLPESDLEGLRVPHFYRAFYVYKYATGLAASIALSERVMNGGDRERDDYLNFLKSGGSKFPLESLTLAGVDMSKPDPIAAAMQTFRGLLDTLQDLLTK